MELLEHTLFINLAHRTDRLNHTLNELQKIGISGERVDAIKHDVGAIGCTMSHIKCLEIAIERNYDKVFICEDDITFLDVELFKKNITQFVKNNGILWDVLIISGNNVPPFQQINDYCARVFYCQCTTGYVVKNFYYNTLLQNFKTGLNLLIQNPTRKPEFALDMYWKQLQLNDFWYMIIPPTVVQCESYSDVENRITDYKFLMTDMNKEWYVKQQQQQQQNKYEV